MNPTWIFQVVSFEPQMQPEDPRAPSLADISPTQQPCTWPLQPLFPLPSDEPQPFPLASLPVIPSEPSLNLQLLSK